MAIAPVLRQLMADRISLLAYYDGRLPTFGEVRRRLVLLERRLDTGLPDHHYKRSAELELEGVDSLPRLLSEGLPRLAGAHLTMTQGRVWVRDEALDGWMECLTLCAPLPLLAAMVWRECFEPCARDPARLWAFVGKHVAPNVRHTCLPSPRFLHLDALKERGGFHDLHVHLNGSTETDRAWLHFLKNPLEVNWEAQKGYRESKIVREQWEQELPVPDGKDRLLWLLLAARRIRWGMVQVLFGQPAPAWSVVGAAEFLKGKSRLCYRLSMGRIHPLARPLGVGADADEHLLEALLHVLVLDELRKNGSATLAHLYHNYLLILGFVNGFLVQQVYQVGFDQFQKVTLNELRELPEKRYAERFLQMQGNGLDSIGHVEGRFAPKATARQNVELLAKIRSGWARAEEARAKAGLLPANLKLVAHFIKKQDKGKLETISHRLIRHGELRHSLRRQAWALLSAREYQPRHPVALVGVDAASNELEAPPEVFAPLFRFLRRRGVPHFTYHAGEDFHHLLGGLRAIWEAVTFCDLQKGDRIGHATAAGIDPALWLRRIGGSLVVSRGEWLDDLVFLLDLMEQGQAPQLTARYARIVARIEQLCMEVYDAVYTVAELRHAWQFRKYCPYHLLATTREDVAAILWDETEWRLCRNEAVSPRVREFVARYHQNGCRKQYHTKIKLGDADAFGKEELAEAQQIVLRLLHRREIVLETLPSSNTRISFYQDMAEHHLWRWLRVAAPPDLPAVPPVVVGTDDTGIFATNIYNEYSRIYGGLITHFGVGQEEAARHVEQLERNSRVYRFCDASTAVQPTRSRAQR